MSPQRIADAVHITPYLTHIVNHHGRTTLVPPDNAGRIRQANPKKNKGAAGSGPSQEQSSSNRTKRNRERPPESARAGAASRVQPEDFNDDIPDYPPPTFQEAMSSPPMSACPSSTTLPLSMAQAVDETSHSPTSDGGSEQSESLEVIDTPVSTEPRSGPSIAPARRPMTPQRGRARESLEISTSNIAPLQERGGQAPKKRRHLSLSPLKTLLPSKPWGSSDLPRSLASHSTGSFSRSTASLPGLFGITSPETPSSPVSFPPSSSHDSLLSRRLFHRRREHPVPQTSSERIEEWEVVDSSAVNMDSVSVSPTLSTPTGEPVPAASIETVRRNTSPAPPMHTPEDDALSSPTSAPRQESSVNQEPRSLPTLGYTDRDPDPPATQSGLSRSQALPRRRRTPPPPPPARRRTVVGSPLRSGFWSAEGNAIASTLPPQQVTAGLATGFPPTIHDLQGSQTMPPGMLPMERPLQPTPFPSKEQPILPPTSGHHYPGRPLPRPPTRSTATRSAVDSVFSGPGERDEQELASSSDACPEGLLIDLDDEDSNGPTASRRDDYIMSVGPSAGSSVDRLVVPSQISYSSSGDSASSVAETPSTGPLYSDLTELDVLASQIGDERDGRSYDNLLLLEEFLGPATVHSSSRVDAPGQRPRQVKLAPIRARIVVQRRRVTRDGRVKLKLMMKDAAVDKCGICLTQFRQNEPAAMSPSCRHAFHDVCLGKWLRRSETCPLCRVPLKNFI